jgi:hypothetical protein
VVNGITRVKTHQYPEAHDAGGECCPGVANGAKAVVSHAHAAESFDPTNRSLKNASLRSS